MAVNYISASLFTKGAAFVEQRFVIEVPNDVGIDDLLRPDFWKHVSDRVRRLALITVIGGKDDLDVDLRCMSQGNGYCMMKVVRMAPRADEIVDVDAREGERTISYLPGFKWSIIGADGGILEHGFDTREDASKRLEDIDNPEMAA